MGIKRDQGLLIRTSNTIEILITKEADLSLHFCNLTSSDVSMCVHDLDYLGTHPKKANSTKSAIIQWPIHVLHSPYSENKIMWFQNTHFI